MPGPIFSSPSTNPFELSDVGNSAIPSLVDMDGDGHLDALVGNQDGNTLFHRNTGSNLSPSFVAPSTNPFELSDVGNSAIPSLVDMDGDGHLDAFIGERNGNTRFFFNGLPSVSAGIIIAPSGGSTQATKDGATDSYTFVLDTAPTNDVTITLNGGTQLSTNVTTLIFTAANWNVAQTVTVTAINDPIGEGPHRGVINATVTSTDANYNGITVANVVAQISDNDIPQQDPTFQTATANPFGLTDVGDYATPTLADIDGDGDLDAFLGNGQGNTLFYRNTGGATSPAFGLPTTNPFGLTDVGAFAKPTLVDIDGDGDLDAFVGNSSGNTLFYRNTGSAGSPAFGLPTTNPFGLTNVAGFVKPTLVDIDGDGDLDAFVGNQGGNTLFYRNTGSAGSPAFGLPTTNPFGLTDVGYSAAPTFADIDGDGDLDAFIGNRYGNTLFYRNTGSAGSPAFGLPTTNPFGLTDVGASAAPTFADIDGDGDLDAFIGNSFGNTFFFLNGLPPTPAGVTLSAELIQVAEGGMTATYTVVLDSAPTDDVTITLNPGNQLSVDTTTLTFTAANFATPQTVTVTAIDDAIGEGPHRGVITATVSSSDANYNGITVANVVAQISDNDIPQQDPTFQTATANPFGLTNVGSYASPTFVDIDGDGDLDAFLGDNVGNTVFYRNTGSATSPAFGLPTTNPFGLTDVGAFAKPTLVDIDGDGDLDAFVGNYDGNTLFYRNTGSAGSPAFGLPTTNPFGLTDVGYSAAPTFADIDGDGDLDAFVGERYGNTLFYRNTGSAGSPAFGLPTTNPFGLTDVGYSAAPTFADIDGDGDLDAFVGNSGGDGEGNTFFFLNGLPPTPAGVTLSAELIQVAEGGMTATYTVVLDSAPTDDVTITLNPGNQLSVDTTTLTFTAANFATPQTVTVTAIDDAIGEGPHRGVITATVASTDANYDGITVANVVAQISDNDIPQQDPSFQTGAVNPFGLTNVGSFAKLTFADIDGDGDLDAFVGNSGGNTLFYQNTGGAASPAFAAPETNPFGLTDVGTFAKPTLVDIDGDGDLDAFVGNSQGNTLFYRNTGSAASPAFASPETNPFGLTDVGTFAKPTLVDIDGDGDLDAFVGNSQGNTLFYRNTGSASSPAFGLPTTNPFGLTDVGGSAAPTLADIDGDGDLDAFIGNRYGNTLFYRNTGSAGSPAFGLPTTNPFGLTDVGSFADPTFADIDGDGDLDAFVGNSGGDGEGNTFFFLNGLPPTPAGVTLSAELIQVAEGGMTATYTVVLDSAPTDDVTITLNPGNQLSVDTTTLTFTAANFATPQTVTVTAIDDPIGEGPHRGVITATVASTDANYDGITVANVVAQISDNDIPQQDPSFQTGAVNPFGLTNVGSFAKLTFADIDGDGDLDAFVGKAYGNTLFYQNTGSAGSPAFAAPTVNPFGLTDVGFFAAPTFADIDGDGDLDAFVGNAYGNTVFYRNTGSAGSPAFGLPTTNPFGLTDVGYNAAPTFADIDGDGDLDAFVGNFDGNTVFYRNTGSAGSPAFGLPTTNPFGLTDVGGSAAPTLADIDGDGDLDAFVGNNFGNTVFYRNTGSATDPLFATPTTNPFGLTDVGSFAKPTFADIDGDGDLDAFVGNSAGNTLFFLNGLPPNEPGTIQFNNSAYSVNEGGGPISPITLTRTGGSDGAVSVTLTPSNGTATSPADFNNAAITVNFANGENSKTVAVPIVNDTLVEGNETVNLTLSNATNGAVLGTQTTAVLTIVDDDTAPTPLYFSVLKDQRLGNLPVANEDIIVFDRVNFRVYFDGSAVGLSNLAIDAFDILSPTEILLSFCTPTTLGTLSVDDSDIVKFTQNSTRHNFSLYFDGSDVGLTTNNEDLDALSVLNNGDLLISTKGAFSVPGLSGKGNDILLFRPTSLGDTTQGTWSPYFIGDNFNLLKKSESVDALGLQQDTLYLSTVGNFDVPNISGRDEDIFGFTATALSTNGAISSGQYKNGPLFDGSFYGLSFNDITGTDFGY